MNPIIAALLVIVAVGCARPAAAQQRGDGTTYELTLRDGSRMYGTVEGETGGAITFRTMAGVAVTTPRDQILVLRKVEGVTVEGEFWPADPNTTRLFFGPTARALPRGQAYLGVYEFLMPSVHVGITDRLSFGGGTPLVFGFGDDGARPIWITPKLQIVRHPKADVALGALHVFNLRGEDVGVAYAVMTSGTSRGSITAGGGVAYSGRDGRSLVVMVGGDRPIRRNMKFVTENYYWASEGVLSAGIRFFGERLSADLAMAVPIGTDLFVAVPVVNFVYLF